MQSFFVHAGLLPILDVCSRSSHLSLTFFTHHYIRKLKKNNDKDENEAAESIFEEVITLEVDKRKTCHAYRENN